jgi:PhnB protein
LPLPQLPMERVPISPSTIVSEFTALRQQIFILEAIMARAIPQGYHSVTPYLIIKGAADAMDFYKRAFGATEVMRMARPDGKIGHAEITIGDSHIMLADEYPEMGHRSPQSIGGAGVSLMVYLERVDDVFKRAIAAGAKELQPIKDQFYGDRSGTLQDPFGHVWTVATHVEDVPPEEMRRRAEKFMQQEPKA